MADPALTITLDVQHPTREFNLILAAGTSPAIEATILDGGAAFSSLSGWSAKLYHFEDWQATEVVAVDSASIASNVITFQPDPADMAVVGTRAASVVLTGPSGELVEWGRGTIELRESPPTMDSAVVSLATPVNWDTKTFTGTSPWYSDQLAGSKTLTAAATSAAVDISSLGLSVAPSQVLVTLEIPSGGSLIVTCVSGITSTEFTALFSAAIPASGYVLHWMLVA